MTATVTDSTPARVTADNPAYLRGPVLRATLPPLAVLLVVLTGVLSLAALGFAITPTATLLAVGGCAVLVLAGVALAWKLGVLRPGVFNVRNLLGGIVTVVVLIGAVAAAQAMQPTVREQFVSLQTTDTAVYANGSLTATASGAVTVGWEMRGYGVDLAEFPAVKVTVDGSAPADLTLVPDDPPAADGTDETSETAGSVTFTAPADPGRYEVVVTVSDSADPAGTQELTLQLVVTT